MTRIKSKLSNNELRIEAQEGGGIRLEVTSGKPDGYPPPNAVSVDGAELLDAVASALPGDDASIINAMRARLPEDGVIVKGPLPKVTRVGEELRVSSIGAPAVDRLAWLDDSHDPELALDLARAYAAIYQHRLELDNGAAKEEARRIASFRRVMFEMFGGEVTEEQARDFLREVAR